MQDHKLSTVASENLDITILFMARSVALKPRIKTMRRGAARLAVIRFKDLSTHVYSLRLPIEILFFLSVRTAQ